MSRKATTASSPVFNPLGGRAAFFVATLESCLAQIKDNADAIAAGAADAEFIHQLRVGLRRMNTAMRELSDFAPDVDPTWQPAFAHAFRQLGLHRDQDHVIPALAAALSEAGLPALKPALSARLDAPSAAEIVSAPRFQQTLHAALEFCADAQFRHAEAGSLKRLKQALKRRLARLHQRLQEDARRFKKLSSKQQHRVRKRAKRLRYLSEFAIPVYGRETVQTYLRSWRRAQDALGELNDLWVAVDSGRLPDDSATREWLDARLNKEVKRSGRALRAALKRPLFA